jgi:hypothetical protein
MEEFVLEDVVTVLGPDGAVDPATDPGLPPARVVALYEACTSATAPPARATSTWA